MTNLSSCDMTNILNSLNKIPYMTNIFSQRNVFSVKAPTRIPKCNIESPIFVHSLLVDFAQWGRGYGMFEYSVDFVSKNVLT